MSNRIVKELIKKSKAANVKNRGAYPVTIATNVIRQDGTPLEEKTAEELPIQEILEPDVVINPSDAESTPITEVIESVEKDAVISVSDGEIAVELTFAKGVVIQGANAGVPQNYKQEV